MRVSWLKLGHADYSLIIPNVAVVCVREKVRLLAVDSTGVGKPIVEMLNSKGVKTEAVNFKVASADDMIKLASAS
ncbi:MAG TPA: hypothetical protein VJN71_06140 [Nitrososphaerales archaeon]|nr:hypothetical protein [Nitrososphaerales archaeon]